MIIKILKSVFKWCIIKIRYGRSFNVKLTDGIHISAVRILIKDGSITFNGRVGCRHVTFNVNDSGKLYIGDRVFINDGTMINVRQKVSIGDRTLIGQNVLIYDHDHDYKSLKTIRDKYIKDDVIIGNDVWIGSNVVILRGSHIGDGSVIGAGTIVKGDIASSLLIYPKQDYVERKLER